MNQIEQLALSNKYTKWYLKICENAALRCSTKKEAKHLLGYTEAHHILPKCFKLGGTSDKLNLVNLTLREHFIMHWLATKMFSSKYKSKMNFAFTCLVNLTQHGERNFNSIQYSAYRKAFIERQSTTKSKPMSEETKKKISDANKGKQSRIGCTHSDATKEKLKAPRPQCRGKLTPEEYEKRNYKNRKTRPTKVKVND